MERTTWSWAHKAALAVVAFVVACCCAFLSGCAENSEEAVRNLVSSEFDQVKQVDADTIEEYSTDSAEITMLRSFGVTPADIYEALFDGFDYEIKNIEVEGDKATVSVVLSSKDFTNYQSDLSAAVQSEEFLASVKGLPTEEVQAAAAQLLLKEIKDLPVAQSEEVSFTCVKKDGRWQLGNDVVTVFQEVLNPSDMVFSGTQSR